MVTCLNGVQTERGSPKHEISWFQSVAETTEITPKPLNGFPGTTSHRPQASAFHGHIADGNGQSAGVGPIPERRCPKILRDDRADVDPVIGDKFRKRLAWGPEHKLVQFNHGKGRGDLTVKSDPKRHLAFDRGIGISFVPKRRAGIVEFAAKQSRMDRTTHAELFDYTSPNATDFVPDDSIATDATKVGEFHLDVVSLVKCQ